MIEPLMRGGQLRARLLWEPIGSTPDNWIIATYLIDASGQIRAQDDRQPCDGSYSTSRWQTTDLISDDRTLAIPEDLPSVSINLLSRSIDSATTPGCLSVVPLVRQPEIF